FISICGDI
ncbi:unnamed protein product, partial [Leptidea sinapis]